MRDLLLQNVQQLLQNVHGAITKCTSYYYRMYMVLLQNVQALLQNVQGLILTDFGTFFLENTLFFIRLD